MAELTIPIGIDTAQAMQTLRSLGQLADQQFDKKRKVQIDDAAIKQFGDNLAGAMQRANRALNFDDAFDQANSKVGELEASLQGAVLAFGKNSPIAQGLVQDLIKAKQEAKQFNDAIALCPYNLSKFALQCGCLRLCFCQSISEGNFGLYLYR